VLRGVETNEDECGGEGRSNEGRSNEEGTGAGGLKVRNRGRSVCVNMWTAVA
jgi:hypothetical protein